MIKAVVADDHAIFLEGLSMLLKKIAGITVVGQAREGNEALDLIKTHNPDLAILDNSMPGISGLRMLKVLASEALKTRVIILTMHTEPGVAAQAMKSGAFGYLVKQNTFDELSRAIKTVMAGNTYVSPSLCTQFPLLTRRETEILTMIASGNTNRIIARTLGISIKTVDTHRTRIMDKLDLHCAADLTRYAAKCGLIQP